MFAGVGVVAGVGGTTAHVNDGAKGETFGEEAEKRKAKLAGLEDAEGTAFRDWSEEVRVGVAQAEGGDAVPDGFAVVKNAVAVGTTLSGVEKVAQQGHKERIKKPENPHLSTVVTAAIAWAGG